MSGWIRHDGRMSGDASERDEALRSALDDTVRWRRCEAGLLPHRREPLLRERLWLPRGCWLDDAERGRGTVHRVGLDAAGRVRIVGPDRDPGGWADDDVATVTWDGASSRVQLFDRSLAYLVDDCGRVVEARMVNGGDVAVECYRRDGEGRVVHVQEHGEFGWNLGGARTAPRPGATMTVEHDERGPVRVTDAGRDGFLVWERCDRPWPELLADGARTIARQVLAGIERRVDDLGARGTEVFSLTLTYCEDSGSLWIEPASFGVEAERRAWLRGDLDAHTLGCKLFYTVHDSHGLDWIDLLEWDDDLDWLLMREAALDGPGDPYTTVLDEVCRVLARHDWDALVTPTDDCVVYCAEHDEDIPPKVRAIRAANPPDRLAAWDATFPAHVSREDRCSDLWPAESDRVWC